MNYKLKLIFSSYINGFTHLPQRIRLNEFRIKGLVSKNFVLLAIQSINLSGSFVCVFFFAGRGFEAQSFSIFFQLSFHFRSHLFGFYFFLQWNFQSLQNYQLIKGMIIIWQKVDFPDLCLLGSFIAPFLLQFGSDFCSPNRKYSIINFIRLVLEHIFLDNQVQSLVVKNTISLVFDYLASFFNLKLHISSFFIASHRIMRVENVPASSLGAGVLSIAMGECATCDHIFGGKFLHDQFQVIFNCLRELFSVGADQNKIID